MVGEILLNQSASTVKKVSLELGGLGPFIVFPSADLDAATNGLIGAKFRNTGQTCISANNILIHQGIILTSRQNVLHGILNDNMNIIWGKSAVFNVPL
jgi:succinate-semialdehyde dehydrogenase/glutarate-semialdehyde dehydrogenase